MKMKMAFLWPSEKEKNAQKKEKSSEIFGTNKMVLVFRIYQCGSIPLELQQFFILLFAYFRTNILVGRMYFNR